MPVPRFTWDLKLSLCLPRGASKVWDREPLSTPTTFLPEKD